MGARGAAPRLLRLKAEDVAAVGGAPLTKGKFTWVTESGREERWIVASCGTYTVLWNFRRATALPNPGLPYGLCTLVVASSPAHLPPTRLSVTRPVLAHIVFT